MMRVILAGGGTGGHIYPAITIAREFLRRDPQTEILFIGGKRGLESDIIPKEGFKLVTLNLAGIPRQVSPKVFTALWLAAKGMGETFKIVREFKPDFVVGTGGYVCGPMVLAATIQGIPTAIQEQNAFPGLTNRILGHFVKHIFLAYTEAGKYFPAKKISVSGNPIRSEEFSRVSRVSAEKNLGLKPDHTNLLVFGGSQSARRINQSLLPITKKLLENFPKLQIILMTGSKEYDNINKVVKSLELTKECSDRLKLVSYFYKIAEAYKVSDIVLARAGAISLAEITCFGIPALLVPYPYATNNHQEFNARVLEKAGAAKIILEQDLTSDKLWTNLNQMLLDEQLRLKMSKASLALSKPQAAQIIVDDLLKIG
jgi:UDP-N-acetylglucosamine--N-acetylmuramyl-(pentapeptide) pyrophosphoryl-undecaprenol N-acetylglucosamine transferase